MSDSSLPKSYSRLLKRYPVFSKALANLGETVRQQGPIDAKTGPVNPVSSSGQYSV